MILIFKNHIRLFLALAAGIAVAGVAPMFGVETLVSRSIVGYDFAAVIYIICAAILMSESTKAKMLKRSSMHDDGKWVVLGLVVMALIFSTSVIFADLALVKNLQGSEKYVRLILSFFTIILSWFFTNLVFTLHYAHDYYVDVQNGKGGGLIFLPEDQPPLYIDFMYFAFVLGATAQTADVCLSSRKMRKTCLLHSILSFFFNTTLIAITINMTSSVL